MTFNDALIVTALGMSVVFSGLILTALLISVFGLASRPRSDAAEATPAPREPSEGVSPPASPEILAVITAVLEVERRLSGAEAGRRLTIARSTDPRRAP